MENFIFQVKTRAGSSRKDNYYIEPETRLRFFSKKDVERYIADGTTRNCKKQPQIVEEQEMEVIRESCQKVLASGSGTASAAARSEQPQRRKRGRRPKSIGHQSSGSNLTEAAGADQDEDATITSPQHVKSHNGTSTSVSTSPRREAAAPCTSLIPEDENAKTISVSVPTPPEPEKQSEHEEENQVPPSDAMSSEAKSAVASGSDQPSEEDSLLDDMLKEQEAGTLVFPYGVPSSWKFEALDPTETLTGPSEAPSTLDQPCQKQQPKHHCGSPLP